VKSSENESAWLWMRDAHALTGTVISTETSGATYDHRRALT
jgi:hypothetical protein